MRQLALVFALCVAFSAHSAEIHKWKDENGRTHYGNTDVPKHAKRVDIRPNVIETDEFDRDTWDRWMAEKAQDPSGDIHVHIGDVNNSPEDEPHAGPPHHK